MSAYEIKRNERDWAGQLISWLKAAIDNKTTIFQDATNDTSIKMESGRTKFPDILLFTDKTSGIIFNGWELKFPDTPVDDYIMLDNALEKAKKIQSDSFVTWNGAEAIIWKINTNHYSVDTLTKIKHYPKVSSITSREDLALASNFSKHEAQLRSRALEILHDLEQLYRNGDIKPAINISDNIISAIKIANAIFVPQLVKAITQQIGADKNFRIQFNQWKVYESSTLRILASSSRKLEDIDDKVILAKFTFYNIIGKIIFYLTLAENLSGELKPLQVTPIGIKSQLSSFFDDAKAIDYQAIFQPYFTDVLNFSSIAEIALYNLIQTLLSFDFKLLPSDVIGTILENLVPVDEKQKFGQYFTPSVLAHLVAFPTVSNNSAVLFDPASGTGTFLNAFYNILSYFGNISHQNKLSQIWGNDVSHFPAILSVINLYKQNVTETDNFPRVIRNDFFNLNVGQAIKFPNPKNHTEHFEVLIPLFDGIASNFPFIQQEDIPNDKLTAHFRTNFELTQSSFVREGNFTINERADYFTYCIYNSIRFLKEGGILSAITSNAWLGKEYGVQFKDFLLNNFHIKYVIRSNAEHWFNDSQVSTIFFVLEKDPSKFDNTRFVTLNFKLEDYFYKKNLVESISMIEELYAQIDLCDHPSNSDWSSSQLYPEHFIKKDGSIEVTLIPKSVLEESLSLGTNWSQYFIAQNPLSIFEKLLIRYHNNFCHVIRGERTGWNPMFIIPEADVQTCGIDPQFLVPYLKTSSELTSIEFNNRFKYRAFVCHKPLSALDKGTKSWINKFVNTLNKNGSATIPEVCNGHHPFWYSLNPKKANIITAINPYERLFFTFSDQPFTIDQRLIALQVNENVDAELIAALLNSVCTLLTLELKGTSRNLGALDLNANYLKELQLLNPLLLDEKGKQHILDAFAYIKKRPILTVSEELLLNDRQEFDKAVLNAYGIDVNILPHLYKLLDELVANRTDMKNR